MRRQKIASVKPGGENLKIAIDNIEIFNLNQRREMNKAFPLLEMYKKVVDENNAVKIPKNQLSKYIKQYLGRQPRTVSSWLTVLVKNNAIKYHTDGTTLLNPNYFFNGSEENFELTLKRWETFKTHLQ